MSGILSWAGVLTFVAIVIGAVIYALTEPNEYKPSRKVRRMKKKWNALQEWQRANDASETKLKEYLYAIAIILCFFGFVAIVVLILLYPGF